MSSHRVFYVTQGSLCIWERLDNNVALVAKFSDDDSGLHAFDRHLAQSTERPGVMLVDVIEEEFALETIPKLRARDRKALVVNRSQRKFRRTPYRVSMIHGASEQNQDGRNVVYSAITNSELVDPWVQIILRRCTPLSGIYSVPMLAPKIFSRLFNSSGNAMFVAPHQGSKLRQSFFRNGKLHGARLSQSPDINDENFARFVVTETMRSRRYLERKRLLGAAETLRICVIADRSTAAKISGITEADPSAEFKFIDPASAAAKLGLRQISGPDRFEEIYISAVAERRPRVSYASSGENRFWLMKRLRSALIGATFTIAAASSVAAAVFASDAWLLKSRNSEVQAQVEQLSDTYRRENERFNPIKADSTEMKLAVDTGEFILENRLPVPWVMNQLGSVLGDFPDVQVHELSWDVEEKVVDKSNARQRARQPASMVLRPVTVVTSLLTAEFEPFDGNMRRAFERIDALVADLESKTYFSKAEAIEYPFDASTSSAISGNLVGRQSNKTAAFQIRVIYEVPTAVKRPIERTNEST